MIKIIPQGRLGNNLLQNIGISILSKKLDLKVDQYINEEQFKTFLDNNLFIEITEKINFLYDLLDNSDEQTTELYNTEYKNLENIMMPLFEKYSNNQTLTSDNIINK